MLVIDGIKIIVILRQKEGINWMFYSYIDILTLITCYKNAKSLEPYADQAGSRLSAKGWFRPM